MEPIGSYYHVRLKHSTRINRKRNHIQIVSELKRDPKINWIKKQQWYDRDPRQIDQSIRSDSEGVLTISDPFFKNQWYLTDLYHNSKVNGLDLGLTHIWSRGYDGTGVVVAVLDDGLDYNNQDLANNYDEKASYDFVDYDNDPMPDQKLLTSSHGTKCAGTIAAAKNNFCGVGVAFNASIGGIRMLNLKTTDSIEANALSYQSDYVDIYSCSWGPKDDGVRFGKPGPLALRALRLGATKGRKALGSIFVWSSGNGNLNGDDCNADGYVTNIYTIAIGSINHDGSPTLYGESCASMLAVTVSGINAENETSNAFITTDMNNKCINNFPGTSSSASVASGIIALMLQANPLLTWRDVQHLIVETSLITNPTDFGWSRNGVGKWFNPLYGFGRLDPSSLIDRSYRWDSVPPQKKCRGKSKIGPWSFGKGSSLIIFQNATQCYKDNEYADENSISKIEHVQLVVSLTHSCRGRLSIELISPMDTRSFLLKPRFKDISSHGIHEWVFGSVHFWGEDSRGPWTIAITDTDDFDPCRNNKFDVIDGFHHKGHKYMESTEHKSSVLSQDEFSSTQEDEAENIETSHEDGDKKMTLKTTAEEILNKKQPNQNNSMIERIVVEKYRIMPSNSNQDSYSHSNQFGDIKVIINDPMKKAESRASGAQTTNDISEETYEDELWRQELEGVDSRNVKNLEEDINIKEKRELKRTMKRGNDENKNKRSDSEKNFVEVTGVLKYVTLVFYGS